MCKKISNWIPGLATNALCIVIASLRIMSWNVLCASRTKMTAPIFSNEMFHESGSSCPPGRSQMSMEMKELWREAVRGAGRGGGRDALDVVRGGFGCLLDKERVGWRHTLKDDLADTGLASTVRQERPVSHYSHSRAGCPLLPSLMSHPATQQHSHSSTTSCTPPTQSN